MILSASPLFKSLFPDHRSEHPAPDLICLLLSAGGMAGDTGKPSFRTAARKTASGQVGTRT